MVQDWAFADYAEHFAYFSFLLFPKFLLLFFSTCLFSFLVTCFVLSYHNHFHLKALAVKETEGYISHDCQNELLKLISWAVQQMIAHNLQTADFFHNHNG